MFNAFNINSSANQKYSRSSPNTTILCIFYTTSNMFRLIGHHCTAYKNKNFVFGLNMCLWLIGTKQGWTVLKLKVVHSVHTFYLCVPFGCCDKPTFLTIYNNMPLFFCWNPNAFSVRWIQNIYIKMHWPKPTEWPVSHRAGWGLLLGSVVDKVARGHPPVLFPLSVPFHQRSVLIIYMLHVAPTRRTNRRSQEVFKQRSAPPWNREHRTAK
jgi:hypothetical protein